MDGPFEFRGDFNWFEYTVFFGTLSASLLIGIYFGLIKNSANTTDGYMLGGKQMPMIPIALSMVCSFISGISLLGLPTEMYLYGTQHLVIAIDILIATAITYYFILPVTYFIGCTNIFEYLERRFDVKLRKIGSAMFAINLILHTPMVIYVPAVAFNQATGVSVYLMAPIICAICIFYTSLGGLKAVVWSDALQALVTLTCVIAVSIIGINSIAGGLPEIIRINSKGERLEFFNMDTSLYARNTFWTVLVGQTSHWTNTLAIHPSTHQRFISLPTYEQAKKITYVMGLGLVFSKSIIGLIGLIVFAKYGACDPIKTNLVSSPTQLFAYMVADISKNYQGLTGLFLAGVVSTALSTMSAGVNTVSGTLYDDFVRPMVPFKMTDRRANIAMKTIAIIVGALCTSMVFLVEKLGTILQLSSILNAVSQGALILVFFFGMCMPWVNSKGALAGAIGAFVTTTFITFRTQLLVASGDIQFPSKVLSIENCPANLTAPLRLNSTTFGYPGIGTKVFFSDIVPWYLKISFNYYGVAGLIVGFMTGLVVSYMTGPTNLQNLDPKLIIPQLRFLLPRAPPHDVYKTSESTESKSDYKPVSTDSPPTLT